jgi:hypothetical protein
MEIDRGDGEMAGAGCTAAGETRVAAGTAAVVDDGASLDTFDGRTVTSAAVAPS